MEILVTGSAGFIGRYVVHALRDMPVTYAGISNAKAKLGYHPTMSLQGGLMQFIERFKGWTDLSS